MAGNGETGAARQVRATHPYAFRSGQWAELIGTAQVGAGPDRPRECYVVRFPDGVCDLWPVHDASYGYEFRDRSVPAGLVERLRVDALAAVYGSRPDAVAGLTEGDADELVRAVVASVVADRTVAGALSWSPGDGAQRIAKERWRQLGKGYTPEHDAGKPAGMFAQEAAAYAEWAWSVLSGENRAGTAGRPSIPWPDGGCEWDPRDPETALVKAGALCAAELDRLARPKNRRRPVTDSPFPPSVPYELAAMSPPDDPSVTPHAFVGRSDRWCELPGCNRPDRNPIHRVAASRDDARSVPPAVAEPARLRLLWLLRRAMREHPDVGWTTGRAAGPEQLAAEILAALAPHLAPAPDVAGDTADRVVDVLVRTWDAGWRQRELGQPADAPGRAADVYSALSALAPLVAAADRERKWGMRTVETGTGGTFDFEECESEAAARRAAAAETEPGFAGRVEVMYATPWMPAPPTGP